MWRCLANYKVTYKNRVKNLVLHEPEKAEKHDQYIFIYFLIFGIIIIYKCIHIYIFVQTYMRVCVCVYVWTYYREFLAK